MVKVPHVEITKRTRVIIGCAWDPNRLLFVQLLLHNNFNIPFLRFHFHFFTISFILAHSASPSQFHHSWQPSSLLSRLLFPLLVIFALLPFDSTPPPVLHKQVLLWPTTHILHHSATLFCLLFNITSQGTPSSTNNNHHNNRRSSVQPFFSLSFSLSLTKECVLTRTCLCNVLEHKACSFRFPVALSFSPSLSPFWSLLVDSPSTHYFLLSGGSISGNTGTITPFLSTSHIIPHRIIDNLVFNIV